MRTSLAVLSAVCSGCVYTGSEPLPPRRGAVTYTESAVIAASAERVWDVLVDLPAYREWNPWLTEAAGDVEPGGEVRVRVILNGEPRDADHIVLAVDPGRRFCWRDAGPSTFFVYGQRCRWIERRRDGSVHFFQELLLDGPLVAVADSRYGEALRKGMAAETAALRRRAEAAWAPTGASATISR